MISKKALVSVGLMFLVSVSVFACFSAPKVLAADVVYGDLSNDGICNSADYTILRQLLCGKISTPPNPNYKVIADLNGDGKVDTADFTILRRYLLKIINKIPLGTATITPTKVPATPTTVITSTPTNTPTNTPTPTPTTSVAAKPATSVTYNLVREMVDGAELNKYIVNVKNTGTGDVAITNVVLGWKLASAYDASLPYAKKTIRPGDWWFYPGASVDGKTFSVSFSLKNNNKGSILPGETAQFCVFSFLNETIPFSYNVYYKSGDVFGGPLSGTPTKDTSIVYVEPVWDEYGNTEADAKQFVVGETIGGNIDYAGDKDCFKFRYPESPFAGQPIEDLGLTILLTTDSDFKCSLPLASVDGTTKRYDITYSSNSSDIIRYMTVSSPTNKTGSYTMTFIRTENLGIGTGPGAH